MTLSKLTSTGAVEAPRPWARPKVYATWLSLLAPADYRAIVAAMNLAVENSDVVRAQYIVCLPGHGEEWHAVYEPVWEAMGRNHEMAGKFIGLILWEVMWNRDEEWYFHKIDKTIFNEHALIEDIQVMEYFRVATLPAALDRRRAGSEP